MTLPSHVLLETDATGLSHRFGSVSVLGSTRRAAATTGCDTDGAVGAGLRRRTRVRLDVDEVTPTAATTVLAAVCLDFCTNGAVESGRYCSCESLQRSAQEVFLYRCIDEDLQRVASLVVLDLAGVVSHQGNRSVGLQAHTSRVVTRVDVDHFGPLVPLDGASGFGTAGEDGTPREVLEPFLLFNDFGLVRDSLAVLGPFSLALSYVVLVGHRLRGETSRARGTACQKGSDQEEKEALDGP